MEQATPSAAARIFEVVRLFAKLGVIGFGGPVAHIALMEQEVVRRRQWVDRELFLDALAVTNLVPGPNSTEMAIHLSYLRAGPVGAVLGGCAFILPALLLMLGLSWSYFRFNHVPEVAALFSGVKPAVIAIIVVTVYRLGRTSVTEIRLLAIFLTSLLLTWFYPQQEMVVLLGAGVVGLVLFHPRRSRLPGVGLMAIVPGLAVAGALSTHAALMAVFLKAGALLFGGGYVMIPLIETDVVETYGWLSRGAFLDGIALGQGTPGPIIITATFVGYAAAGFPGALLATVAIFLPAFAIVTAGTAPFTQRFRNVTWVRAALRGVNAAVVGAILAAAGSLARDGLSDVWALALFAASLFALLRLRLDTFFVVAGSAALGLAVRTLG